MIKHFHKKYLPQQEKVDVFIDTFSTSGKQFGNQKRNSIKLFELDDQTVNIKSFKVPNVFNKIAYRFLRKSKARRSFEYAIKLLDLGIGTPHPIAYYEFANGIFFGKSFYVSEHVDCDLTFRELNRDLNYPDRENMLRAFTKFTFTLHENNVCFLDHSPGNTLIKKEDDNYKFYLVDLNRMQFGELDFEQRMKNFARLTDKESVIKIMSDAYAKCIDADSSMVFEKMKQYTLEFRERIERKKRFKKLVKF